MALRNESKHAKRGWRRYWLLFLASSAVLLVTSKADPNSLGNQLPAQLIQPLTLSAAFVGRGWHDTYDLYLSNATAAKDLSEAQAQIEVLKSQQVEMHQLKQEVIALRKQLEFSESRKDLDLVPATVLARRHSDFSKRLTVEFAPHMTEQIEPGAPVITADALIGQIIDLEDGRAEVMLLSDPRSAVDVRLTSSGINGVAVGGGDEKGYALRLKYISQDQSIENNEVLLTSGKDGKFPIGLPVGQVRSLDGAELVDGQAYTIMPASDLTALRFVFVVRGRSGISADGNGYEEK